MTVVLDADVLIAALDASDVHHEASRRRFGGWTEAGAALVVGAVNLTEVLIAPAARPSSLSRAREAVAALGVTVHRPSEGVAVDAARLRGRHAISLPDAYLLATARHFAAEVATFDRRVERAAVSEGLTSG